MAPIGKKAEKEKKLDLLLGPSLVTRSSLLYLPGTDLVSQLSRDSLKTPSIDELLRQQSTHSSPKRSKGRAWCRMQLLPVRRSISTSWAPGYGTRLRSSRSISRLILSCYVAVETLRHLSDFCADIPSTGICVPTTRLRRTLHTRLGLQCAPPSPDPALDGI